MEMRRFVTTCILAASLLLPGMACAEAPFPGGEVTSPYAEPEHFGHTHEGVDIGTLSGTPIHAPFSGTVEHGAGGGFIYWVVITSDTGEAFLFGDCSPDTLSCSEGYVKEGEIIGYTGGDAYDGPLGKSTGPHCHVEYWPNGYYQGSVADPVPVLLALGVDLSGNIVGPGGMGGGRYGKDNIALPWGVETMYTLGDSLNEMMKTIVEALGKGFDGLQKAGLALLFVLCVIDLALPLLLTGFAFSLPQMFQKIFKYGFLMFLLANWQTFINDFLLSFISSVSGTYVGDAAVITENISQPQLLFQKCVYMVTPGLNKIASFGAMDFAQNFSTILPLYLATFLTLGVYFFLALYIVVCYLEVYLSASVSICTTPFAALGFSRFIPEGTLGHLISSVLKLTLISMMVGLCVFCIRDAEPGELFAVSKEAAVETGSGTISGPPELVALATEKAQKYGIPVNLFLALVQAESTWRVDAVSPAGAQGLGQLMPATAAGLGCDDPFDPEQNLEASAKYFKSLYEMFGDWNLALAGYNGGPNSFDPNEDLPGWAVDYINYVHSNLSGSYAVNGGISSEVLCKYLLFCASLIALALLTFLIPSRIMEHLGGKYELATK